MVRLGAVWRVGLGGAGCLAVGLWLGRLSAPVPQPLWHEPVPVRTAAVLPSFAEVVQRVAPGVVTVRAMLTELEAAGDESAEDGAATHLASATVAPPIGERNGSGFVVERHGLVVTNYHVVAAAAQIEVLVPQRGRFTAEVVGEDLATDLALLRLVDAPDDLPALPLGDSGTLQAGDWIVAIGNPLGLAQTVTPGVVSFVGRHLPHSDFGVTNDFLQISAPVNPGNSGCPIVDLQGRVVGVATQAPIDAQGISFAVPSNTVKWTLAAMQRQRDGRVRRGYLGIEFASFDSTVGDAGGGSGFGRSSARRGALIVRVVEGQPAHRAGVRQGDVVLGVDGAAVQDAKALHDRIVCSDPGAVIALELLRNGELQAPIHAVLGEVGPRRNDPAN
ncbi:MAG: trypsin-like peptidase domain-containing protein [Planctomycetes bacterium]|jgi:serine protease Do|nr:trypsin-like peptidase domain-containing protein [Planctomycetota bacterium]